MNLTPDQRLAILAFLSTAPDRALLSAAYVYHNDETPAEVLEIVADHCDETADQNRLTDSDAARSNVAAYGKKAEEIRAKLPKYALVRKDCTGRTVLPPVGQFTYGRAERLCIANNELLGWVVIDGEIDTRQNPGADIWDFVACEEGKSYEFATDAELEAVS